jgi:hypothetical protein
MHEHNHAETAATSSQFSHKETTNSISTSYGLPWNGYSGPVARRPFLGLKSGKKISLLSPRFSSRRSALLPRVPTLLIHSSQFNIRCLIR